MAKSLTQEQFLDKAYSVHGTKYDYSKSVYVNNRVKIDIICPRHGLFTQLPSSHLMGNGCPKCARIWSEEHRQNLRQSSRKSRGMTTDEWIERVKKVHGDKYDYSQTVYVNQRTNVKIICPIHGLFEQKADSHLRGCGCKKCGDNSENHIGVHSWSDEQREKIKQTCLKRYGTERYLDSVDGKDKVSKIKLTFDFRQKMRDIISSDEVQQKTKMTCLERYGVESPMKSDGVMNKVFETKALNGTWKVSEPEDNACDILCNIFGAEDVKRQYSSNDYPFLCDFYVVSRDLYIELNVSWTHGYHWYGVYDNDDCVLQEWECKAENSNYYQNAIDTWTKRDVNKRNTARQNKLNYLTFWKSDLSDLQEWIDNGCPDGKDWDLIYSWKY